MAENPRIPKPSRQVRVRILSWTGASILDEVFAVTSWESHDGDYLLQGERGHTLIRPGVFVCVLSEEAP